MTQSHDFSSVHIRGFSDLWKTPLWDHWGSFKTCFFYPAYHQFLHHFPSFSPLGFSNCPLRIEELLSDWWFGPWLGQWLGPYIGNFIRITISTDEVIFFRGVGIPPTSYNLEYQTFFSVLNEAKLFCRLKQNDVETQHDEIFSERVSPFHFIPG